LLKKRRKPGSNEGGKWASKKGGEKDQKVEQSSGIIISANIFEGSRFLNQTKFEERLSSAYAERF